MKTRLSLNAPVSMAHHLRITLADLCWLGSLMAATLAATLWVVRIALDFFQQSEPGMDGQMAAGGLLLLAVGALAACSACLVLLYELRPRQLEGE